MSRRRDTPNTAPAAPLRGFDDYELKLGDVMRGERATLGKSLLDVQRDLKIKATYIAAIENADPSAFESPGFIAGYVRSYARYLGLDPEWAYKNFCEEGNFAHHGGLSERDGKGKTRKAVPRHPTGARDPLAQPSVSYVPAGEARFSRVEPGAIGSVAVLMALVGAIGYGGWSVFQEVQKVQFTPVEQTPGVLSQLDPAIPATNLAELAPDDPAIVAPTTEAFDRLYRPQALDVPVLVARDGPIATLDPGQQGILRPPEPIRPAWTEFAEIDPIPPAVPQATGTAVQVVAAGPPTLALFAVRPSWVRVRGADGSVVFEKILDAGERFELPQTEEAHVLRAGNSGSVYFSIGSETYGPAGAGASVVKDVALSVKAITETYAVADLDADADLARFVAVAEAVQD